MMNPRAKSRGGSEPGSRRMRLRDATAERHRALEEAVEHRGFFADQDAYSGYLERLYALYSVLEPALASAGAAELLPDWPRRRKLPALAEDLAVLSGRRPMRPSESAEGIALTGSAAVTRRSLLGTLYVVEGSTLGGALLARRAAMLGFTRERGARYLDIYGPERARMWRGFLGVLETAPLAPCEEAAMLDAAQRTFSLFHRFLGQEPSVPCG